MLGFIKETSKQTKDRITKPKHLGLKLFFIILVFASCLFIWMSSKDFLIWKGDEPEIAPWRKEKLQRELDELNEAEQYVLRAKKPTFFPCFSCKNNTEIFLNPGEIWKYGVTKKGQGGRYPLGLPAENLEYIIEFEGTFQECLKQEKLKIYHYALLPENINRKIPLIRPPGNKRDD